MKERPILFKGEMVCAILAGKKTQTRRIINCLTPDGYTPDGVAHAMDLACKYGVPGDRLWVRETFCELVIDEPGYPTKTFYLATEEEPPRLHDGDGFEKFNQDGSESSPWKSSIFMPRRLSRITLEITDVRVQRLQEISEDDAQAEGAGFVCKMCGNDLDTDEGAEVHFGCDADSDEDDCASCREGYRRIWNSINGADSWDLNPWVWAMTFKRIAP